MKISPENVCDPLQAEKFADQVDMEEHLSADSALKDLKLAHAIQRYCRGLILRFIFSETGAVDRLELSMALRLNGREYYDTEDPVLLLQALTYIPGARALRLDIQARGTCGDFILCDSGHRADTLYACDSGWAGQGLYTVLAPFLPVKGLSYELRGIDSETGATISAEILPSRSP